MKLANRLDALARKKAELEAGEESDDDYQQPDWSVRQGKVSPPRGRGQLRHTVSRQTQQVEEDEEEEEMEEDGVDDELEEDEPQISHKQGTRLLLCDKTLLS